jgi:Flp pilus assembly protein TadD
VPGRPEPLWSPRQGDLQSPPPRAFLSPVSRQGQTEPAPPTPSARDPAIEELPAPRLDAPENVPKGRAEKVAPKDDKEEDRSLLLAAARNAYKQGNFDQALSRFEEYFRRYGDDREVRKEYAGILVQAGRVAEALRTYRQLLAYKPDDRELRLVVADVAVLAKDYRLAAELLCEMLTKEPGNREVATKLARVLVFDDEFARALEVFDHYLAQVRPGDGRAPRLFGALLVDLGRPGDAVPYLEEVLERHPDDTEVRATLVRAFAGRGDQAAALDVLRQVPVRERRDRAIVQDLGDALYASGEYELARAGSTASCRPTPRAPWPSLARPACCCSSISPLRGARSSKASRRPTRPSPGWCC